MNFEEVVYEKKDGVAKIMINRPRKIQCLHFPDPAGAESGPHGCLGG